MNPVGIRELKANLSAYVERARGGEEIIVMHRGVPVVKVIALDHEDPFMRGIREGWLTPGENPERLRNRAWPTFEFVGDPLEELERDRDAWDERSEPWRFDPGAGEGGGN
jgi:prevent-host-death family protein